jgi:hypothetical protein
MRTRSAILRLLCLPAAALPAPPAPPALPAARPLHLTDANAGVWLMEEGAGGGRGSGGCADGWLRCELLVRRGLLGREVRAAHGH